MPLHAINMNPSGKSNSPFPTLHKIQHLFTLNIIVPIAASYIAGAALAYNIGPGIFLLHQLAGLCALCLAIIFFFRKS